MSRTNHDTPAFPRTLRGPRGGRHIAPTPCVECVSFDSCRPGTCSAPFGCESWVDQDGRRVDLDALTIEDRQDGDPYEEPDPQPHADASVRWDLEPEDVPDPEPGWEARHRLRTGLLKSHGGILHNPEPDPDDPDPYAPSSATLSQMSGIFPTDDDDPGPLFGGRKSN